MNKSTLITNILASMKEDAMESLIEKAIKLEIDAFDFDVDSVNETLDAYECEY